MAEKSDPFIGMVIADRYILLDRVASGKTGAIYRAEHALLRHPLAVKLLYEEMGQDEECLQRFYNDVTSSARIESDHIARVSDFGRTPDGRVFVVMEYLDGETLGQVLERERRLVERRALELLRQLSDALSEAHALALIHGDLRPRNIFVVQKKGRELAKLLGIGMMQLAGGASDIAAPPDRRTVLDPHFVSPEQARGAQATVRSDIYSLAAVGYAMLSGGPPFAGSSTFEVLNKQLVSQPTPLRERVPGLSAHVGAAIDRALSKDPEQRFATVAQLVRALGLGLDGVTPPPRASDAESEPITTRHPVVVGDGPTLVEPIKAAPSGAEAMAQAGPPPAAPAEAPKADEDVRSKTLMGVGWTVEEVRQALAAQEARAAVAAPAALHEPSKPQARELQRDTIVESTRALERQEAGEEPSAERQQTLVKGDDVVELKPELFSSATIVPGSAHRPGAVDDTAQEEPDDGKTSSRRRRLTPYDRENAGESGEWFAQGLAAEQALSRSNTNSSLPEIYHGIEDHEGIKRGLSPTLILVGVIGGAAAVLAVVFLLLRGDAPDEERALTQRVIPVESSPAGGQGDEAGRPARAEPPAAASERGTSAPAETAAERGPSASSEASKTTTAAAVPQRTSEQGQPERAAVSKNVSPSPPKTVQPPARSEVATPKVATPKVATPKVATPKVAASAPKPRVSPPSPPPSPPARTAVAADGSDAARRQVSLARAQLQRGAYQRARDLYNDALRLDPRSAPARGGLGEVDFELGNYSGAAKHLRAALALNGQSVRYRVMLGNVYFKQGRTSAAVNEYRGALKIDPNDQAARAGLEVAIRRLAEGGS